MTNWDLYRARTENNNNIDRIKKSLKEEDLDDDNAADVSYGDFFKNAIKLLEESNAELWKAIKFEENSKLASQRLYGNRDY